MTTTPPKSPRFTRVEAETFPAAEWHRGAMLVEWEAEDAGRGQVYLFASPDGGLNTPSGETPRELVVALFAELAGRRAG